MTKWSERAKSLQTPRREVTPPKYSVGDRISGCVMCVDYEKKHNGVLEVDQVHRKDDFFSLCQKATHQGRVVEIWIVKNLVTGA
jgi:hypothetical protein